MLGLDNPLHILFLLVLLLLVFGAKRLPEMGKSLGEGLRGFKSSLSAEETAHDRHEGGLNAALGAAHEPAMPAAEQRVPETVPAAR